MEQSYEAAEWWVQQGVGWIRLGVELLGALVILFGVFFAGLHFLRAIHRGTHEGYEDVRLTLARYLAVALEFQLAADILSTAIAPTWDQIGKLAAIAVIRTVLNFFLAKEMERERREVGEAPAPREVPVGVEER